MDEWLSVVAPVTLILTVAGVWNASRCVKEFDDAIYRNVCDKWIKVKL